MKKTIAFLLFILLSVVLFFKPFFFENKLPIPADTIIGLYHPYRDLYAKDFPNGIPYKNFLITDPIRQQYPWRLLAIENEKNGQVPLWNPYSMAGSPLVGSLQAAAFYPLNILFFILPFSLAWSLLVVLQPLLAGIFLYFYLRNLQITHGASFLGGITFAFCGFSIAWLEWNTLVHTVLWLPFILFTIDKLFTSNKHIKFFGWLIIFILALCSSFLAGHLQSFFYLFLVVIAYIIARSWQYQKSKVTFLIALPVFFLFLLLTFVQWLPTLELILHSARDVDQNIWQQEGWFIPWQHLIQFVAPDFFGNPTTLNYWGTWNYAELVGYVGMIPLVFGLFALLSRRDKKTLFFGAIFFLSLIFALPTFFAKIPYLLDIPFFSSSQPTRLLFLVDFSLAVLAAFGFDLYLKQPKRRNIFFSLGFLLIVISGLWIFVLQGTGENIQIAKRNLYLPTLFMTSALILIILTNIFKNKKIITGVIILLVLLTVVDLLRFGQKFTPFTNSSYLFPSTKILTFLQKDKEQFRIMSTDKRIFPPNFSSVYHLQTVDGYDPLYLKRYGELIAASERGEPNIQPPFGFNRIITPTNASSPIIDLLGVKYVLSFTQLPTPKFTKVAEEGQTKVYKNNDVIPRAFFVKNLKLVETKQQAIDALFDKKIDLQQTAIVENTALDTTEFGSGQATISAYFSHQVTVETMNDQSGFLVLTDSYYPTWRAKVCSVDGCTELAIHRTNYHFRGVYVPAGKHSVIFYNTLL